jgi:uncharacterized SAM-binding protein YcdF (DUF218 family)
MPPTTASHARVNRALFGAAVGLTVGFAWVMAGLGFVHGDPSHIVPLIGAAAGALCGWFAIYRPALWACVAVSLAAAVIAYTPVIAGPAARWVRRDALPSRPLDAVVVLSADVNRAGAMNAPGVERLLAGLEVMRRNQARRLITTRIVNRDDGPPVTSDSDQAAIIGLTPDSAKWVLLNSVYNTHDEALEVQRLLGASRASGASVGVVTSPMHSRRACAVFESVGLTVVCLPSPGRGYAVNELHRPRARLDAFHDYLYERLAMIEYRARGWIPR